MLPNLFIFYNKLQFQKFGVSFKKKKYDRIIKKIIQQGCIKLIKNLK